jgi:hypothetical protein
MFTPQHLLARIADLERKVQALSNIRGLSPIRVTPSAGSSQLIISLDGDDWFPVAVSAYIAYPYYYYNFASAGAYTWIEQTYDQYGNLVDKENGRSGGYGSNPLYEMNDQVITTFPFYAYARRRILSRTYDDSDGFGIAFEFDAPATPGGGTELKGLTFVFDSNTADSDPGAGKFKGNNATQSSITEFYFDNQTADAVACSTGWASLTGKGFIFLQQADDSSKWQWWKWTSRPVDGTGYYKFTVVSQAYGGAIGDGKIVYATFDNGAGFTARKNSTGSVFGPRTRLNLIEGSNVTLTVADDSANDEVDVTIAASSGGTPSLANGQATGTAGTQNLTGTSYADIGGLSLSLGAGTWLISADVGGQCEVQDASGGMPVSSYGYILAQLNNDTDATAVANSERVVCSSSKFVLGTGYAIANGPGGSSINKVLTLAGTKTIKVQAKRVLSAGDSSFVNATVWRDQCLMTAIQIA